MFVHLFFALTVSVRWRLLFPTLCWSDNTKSMVCTYQRLCRVRVKRRQSVIAAQKFPCAPGALVMRPNCSRIRKLLFDDSLLSADLPAVLAVWTVIYRTRRNVLIVHNMKVYISFATLTRVNNNALS
jgi:hypothetical protein